MNIVIPMAGAGQRFKEEGYSVHKPAIPTLDRRTLKEYPMVVCAVMDLPGVKPEGENITFIDRTFHRTDGVENLIAQHYPRARFITVEELTEGQACTCLLAKDIIDNDESLLIAGCDNGMVIDEKSFYDLAGKCDVIAFTFRKDDRVCEKPQGYGWLAVDSENKITKVSVKKTISDNPMEDHAVVATFWFRKGSFFVAAAEKMIRENDRINNEFYVDQVLLHCLSLGFDTRVFEIERYIGWGTPADYEQYTSTLNYWIEFVKNDPFFNAKED